MEATKCVCTDIYVRISFSADCHGFILTKTDDSLTIAMHEVFRNDSEVVYHGGTFFVVDEADVNLSVDFAHRSVTFGPSLTGITDALVSAFHPWFAPREGAIVFSEDTFLVFDEPPVNEEAKRWLPTMTVRQLLVGVDGSRGVLAAIELHCYEDYDEV